MKHRKEILDLLDDAVFFAKQSQEKALQAKRLLVESKSNVTVLGLETMPNAELKDHVSAEQIFSIIEEIKSEHRNEKCTKIPFIKEVRQRYNTGLKESIKFQRWVQSSGIYFFDQL